MNAETNRKGLWLLVIATLLAIVLPGHAQQRDPEDIIRRLTLEEKVKLVVGAGMNIPGMPGMSTVGQTEDKVPGAAGTSHAIPRLGIPGVVMADGPAGVRISPTRKDSQRTYYATGFPVATLISSTFDVMLMEEVGRAYGNEVKEFGIDFLLAPALNLHRNPLGGRNFEYYSEDPLVSGKMAAAFVRGVQYHGVGAVLKHFAANNQETNRTKSNTIVSERALRELYLKGFEIAVRDGKPWSVMSSYNLINGVYASESPELLTTILRDEWGFNGFVMTDWFGGQDAIKQMIAGNDLLMPGILRQEQVILEAVKCGQLAEEVLDRNVMAILSVYERTPSFKGFAASGSPDLERNRGVARRAAAEGMVLLKNNGNTLPLKKSALPIALLGVGSYETVAGGTGSGDVNKAYVVSVAEGLGMTDLAVSAPLGQVYERYIAAERAKMPRKRFFFEPDKVIPEMDWDVARLDSLADKSSVAVFTITRTSGEFADRKVQDDFNLTATEMTLMRKVSDAFHEKGKKLVVLLNIGGVIETSTWKEFADAVLVIWQPGQEGGHAVADVLTGAVNPSGRLPMTFPVNYDDTPSGRNFPGRELEPNPNPGGFNFQGVKTEVIYEEDIYVGYRYFDSFNVPVSFAFGSGLSYTTFSFNKVRLTRSADGAIVISVDVKNTGKNAGKEVVQVYVQAPRSNIEKPAKELRTFTKTKLLNPGESQTVSMTIHPIDLASFDAGSSAWVTDAGKYTFLAGRTVDDLPLKSVFRIKSPVTQKTNKVLVPKENIKVLKR